MPPPTPLPIIAQLIGVFRQGFWRRLAGRLFRRGATEQADNLIEEFILPLLEAISQLAAAVEAGTYRKPELSPGPPEERGPRQPDEPPETSGRKPQPAEAEPEPPWLSGPLQARPRRPRPPARRTAGGANIPRPNRR